MAETAASKPLFPILVPGALDGLLDGLGGDDAEDHRHARLQGHR